MRNVFSKGDFQATHQHDDLVSCRASAEIQTDALNDGAAHCSHRSNADIVISFSLTAIGTGCNLVLFTKTFFQVGDNLEYRIWIGHFFNNYGVTFYTCGM